MNVAEMRMLKWMCGKTKRDKIRNERICLMTEVALIEDKIRIYYGGLVIYGKDQ